MPFRSISRALRSITRPIERAVGGVFSQVLGDPAAEARKAADRAQREAEQTRAQEEAERVRRREQRARGLLSALQSPGLFETLGGRQRDTLG